MEVISTRMSIPELARRLAVSEKTVYAMLNDGTLPALRRWHIFRAAIEEWEKWCGRRNSTSTADLAIAA